MLDRARVRRDRKSERSQVWHVLLGQEPLEPSDERLVADDVETKVLDGEGVRRFEGRDVESDVEEAERDIVYLPQRVRLRPARSRSRETARTAEAFASAVLQGDAGNRLARRFMIVDHGLLDEVDEESFARVREELEEPGDVCRSDRPMVSPFDFAVLRLVRRSDKESLCAVPCQLGARFGECKRFRRAQVRQAEDVESLATASIDAAESLDELLGLERRGKVRVGDLANELDRESVQHGSGSS